MVKQRVSQEVFFKGITQHQKMMQEHISTVIVQSSDPKDPRGISFKVTREVGKRLAARMASGQHCQAVVIGKTGLEILRIISVNNSPAYQLNYAMRWVYQVLDGSQFAQEYRKELDYVNSLGA